MDMLFICTDEGVAYEGQIFSLMTLLCGDAEVPGVVPLDLWFVGSFLREEWFLLTVTFTGQRISISRSDCGSFTNKAVGYFLVGTVLSC